MVGVNTGQEEAKQGLYAETELIVSAKFTKQSSDNSELLEEDKERILEKIERGWHKFDIDHLIKKAGDTGNYQKLIFINAMLVMFTGVFAVFIVNFVVPDPEFQCKTSTGDWTSKGCYEGKACKLLAKGLAKLKWPYPNNWTERYGYYCDHARLREVGKAMVLICATFIGMAMLMVADFIGRKKVLITGTFLIVIGMTCALLADNLMIKLISMGISGAAEGIFSSLFTIFINENTLSTTKLRSTLITGCFLAYGIGTVFINILTLYIRSAGHLMVFALVVIFLASFPSFFSYYESPRYLHKSGKLQKLIKVLHKISVRNEKGLEEHDFFAPTLGTITDYEAISELTIVVKVKVKHEGPKQNACSVFFRWKYIKTYFLLAVLGSAINLLFFGMNFSIQDLGLSSINLNGIFYGVTQSVAYVSIVPFAHKIRRKQSFIYTQIAILLGAAALAVLSKVQKTPLVALAETTISTCLMTVVNSIQFVFFYAYLTESFPTVVRGLASGLVICTSRVVAASFPYVKAMSQRYGYHVLVGCSILTVISLPLTFFGTETLVHTKVKKLEKVSLETSGQVFDDDTHLNQRTENWGG